MSRAEALRLRIFRVLGHGGVTEVANRLGEHRPYVSGVLSGKITSAPMLDKIDACLNTIEKEQAQAA